MGVLGRAFACAVFSAVAACSPFGSDTTDAPADAGGGTPRERSVECGSQKCTGKQACCADSQLTCAESCTGLYATLLCDDASDCPVGQVCCADLERLDSGDINVSLHGSTCRVSCAGPNQPRLCAPLAANPCDGKSCVPLSSSQRKTYPGGLALSICE